MHIAGPEVYANTKYEDRADKTIEYVENMLYKLNKICGLPTKLSQTNVKKEDFNEIAKKALDDGAMIVNPKQVDFEDVMDILEKAF